MTTEISVMYGSEGVKRYFYLEKICTVSDSEKLCQRAFGNEIWDGFEKYIIFLNMKGCICHFIK